MNGGRAKIAIAGPRPGTALERRIVSDKARRGRWTVDDAGEQDAVAVLAEMPPPARLVYRRVLRPRYDAQHRWQIPSPTAKLE